MAFNRGMMVVSRTPLAPTLRRARASILSFATAYPGSGSDKHA